ncbi:50s ribosomal protein l24 : 50S ribosomal protein L24 OS=Rhodopirellula maiorica SM1 GN=rplX PE=3 SV=1: KOW [Gemmata massiliana]|uniref:Large ribosomal subunit protein uL24 n=1 Tax=Gemmata massiliana TaxID=1210884 RepID=A0A6P2DDV6_9BACT|nr:50S ribosomal protein L24 [Gemmata massiliana]VTR99583.1 50s ribosomal protein l24 : 50S ribosomal protein L24 OS=Rhodopirellula maiorica SM1 GN=rplX PE=3 SV=1: KOW [Gemmata massiliana]
MYICKNDVVQVIAGDDKGTRGKVLRVLRSEGKVVVEGVNRVYRHLKPSRRNPQGGRLSKEMPVDASNVMLIDPVQGVPTRVGVRSLPDGSKELFAKKSGTRIRVLKKAKVTQK